MIKSQCLLVLSLGVLKGLCSDLLSNKQCINCSLLIFVLTRINKTVISYMIWMNAAEGVLHIFWLWKRFEKISKIIQPWSVFMEINWLWATVCCLVVIIPIIPCQNIWASLVYSVCCQLMRCRTVKLPVFQQQRTLATCCRGCWSTCFSGDPWARPVGARCRPCGCCSGPPGSWRPRSCAGGPVRMMWTPRWCCRGTAGPHGRHHRRPWCDNPAGTRHHRQRSWDPFSSLDLQWECEDRKITVSDTYCNDGCACFRT